MKKINKLPPPPTEDRILELLSAYGKQRVSVLGDVGIDRYTQGAVERISPEAPVPIVFVQQEYLKLGLAANVADNILALGGSVDVVGVIGRDQDGADLKDMFKKTGIGARLVTDSSRRTILKERIVAETQQILRVDYENVHPLTKEIQSKVEQNAIKGIERAQVLIIEDYAKGLLNQRLIRSAIRAARKKKIPVLVDPHMKTPLSWYQGATLLTPNKREAEALAGERIEDAKSLIRVGHKIMSVAKAKSVIITLGKEGMAIFKDSKANPTIIPTFAQEVYDVSGAGDTVISILALSLASGASVEEAGFISNLAAGIEVSKRGTATVSPNEILQAYFIYND